MTPTQEHIIGEALIDLLQLRTAPGMSLKVNPAQLYKSVKRVISEKEAEFARGQSEKLVIAPHEDNLLVRVNECFKTGSEDPELIALRGKLCRYIGFTNPLGNLMVDGNLEFGYGSNQRAIAHISECEIIDARETKETQNNDLIKLDSDGSIARIITCYGNETYEFQRVGGKDTYGYIGLKRKEFRLMPSDTVG